MRFLHDSHVVHRDLKSPNVLLDRDGRAKIGDFGLSSYNLSTVTHVTAAIDTPQWTAPEVLVGSPEMSSSADVYSFGVILWELLTGKVPWEGLAPLQIAAQIIQGSRLALSDGLQRLQPVVSRLILDCLSDDVATRPNFTAIHGSLCDILLAYRERAADPSARMPPSFFCPISMEVMADPVICADGYSYERANIENWLRRSNRSPQTNLPLAHIGIIPNLALRNAIQEFH